MVVSKDQNPEQGERGLGTVYTNESIWPHRIQVHFKDAKGNLLKTVEANEGDDLLGVAHEYDIDLEGM